ncbi:COX15/CtaA family protein [Planctomicrobium sp. SH664]|uniref:COX15/CtaA family protein n=1 Tax=Planctomicrobium sp. SH664 TaxID=3448125 RepID=UPI003F5BCFE1
MKSEQFHPGLHRFAVSEIFIALITLTFGALVTTKNAGMAFTDWPTSDGYLMVTYPWLRDFARNWDKFLEHGHRLAGMLIGIWSIGLVIYTWRVESRMWVRSLAASILLGVICQGLLGGMRVQLDERGLAMLHGIFAAAVFSLMGTFAAVTSRKWEQASADASLTGPGLLKPMAVAVVAVLSLQYVLGSFIRHRGSALHEHLGLGILALVLISVNLFVAWSRSGKWLKWSSTLLFVATLGQIGLGLSAWVAKYGFARLGYVAVADSIQQVSLRTTHMVWGTLVMMAAVVHLVKVFRVAGLTQPETAPQVVLRPASSGLAGQGGAR